MSHAPTAQVKGPLQSYLLSSNSSILRHSWDRMNAQTCFGYSLASQTQKSQLQGGCRPVVLRIPFIKEQMYSYKSCGRWGLSRIAQSPSAVYFWSKGRIIMPPSIAVLVKYYIWSRPNCPMFLWVSGMSLQAGPLMGFSGLWDTPSVLEWRSFYKGNQWT